MKKWKKVLGKLLLTAAVVAAVIPGMGKKAEAKTYKETSETLLIMSGKPTTVKADFNYMKSYGYSKVTVSSSNSKVIKVKKQSTNRYKFSYRKTGTATVTYKFYKKGKKKPVVVRKIKTPILLYKAPFSTFKVGGIEYASDYNKDTYTDGYGSGAVTYKLKKGWKLVKAGKVDYSTGMTKTISSKNLRVEKGEHLILTLKKDGVKVEMAYEADLLDRDEDYEDWEYNGEI